MRRPIRVSKRSKYHSRATWVDDIRFASLKEAKRYGVLLSLNNAGRIRNLELQPRYPCTVGDVLVCVYVADFRYFDVDAGALVVEDCKGFKTPIYRLKKKLVEAIYGIEIRET